MIFSAAKQKVKRGLCRDEETKKRGNFFYEYFAPVALELYGYVVSCTLNFYFGNLHLEFIIFDKSLEINNFIFFLKPKINKN